MKPFFRVSMLTDGQVEPFDASIETRSMSQAYKLLSQYCFSYCFCNYTFVIERKDDYEHAQWEIIGEYYYDFYKKYLDGGLI